jgi:hypothetical protein
MVNLEHVFEENPLYCDEMYIYVFIYVMRMSTTKFLKLVRKNFILIAIVWVWIIEHVLGIPSMTHDRDDSMEEKINQPY